jgi:hypothetical protein
MLVSRFSRPPACLSSLWPQRAVDWQQHFGCPTAAAWLLALRCCSTAVVCDAALQGIHQVDNAAPSQQSALPLLFCAKLKHLVRKAVARSAETICVTTGEILRAFYAHRLRQLFPKLRLCLKASCSS